jgi:GNAT superfamily N-acetyltransferase
MDVRTAEQADVEHLAKVWYEGWQDAHAALMPADLTRLRTPESFRERLRSALPNVRVIGPAGAPVGFCIERDNELYQLFVDAAARGSGAAARLLADAEARMIGRGVTTAWLACAIGNERAARFYEKSGWRRAGTMINQAETSTGTFAVETWRYEKALRG